MKTLKIAAPLILLLILALSCFLPKKNKDNKLNSISAILDYKDSIDCCLANLKRQKSLPFSAGDYTFLITKYFQSDKTTVLVEQGDSGEYGSVEKRYYLKNGTLALYTEKAVHTLDTLLYTEARAFYNNGSQFAAETKTASNKEDLLKTPFRKSKSLAVHIKTALRHYEDALNETGQFDLAFDEIIEYPKAVYIVLGPTGLNPYRSALLIRKQDNFIRELINNPLSYRGRRLKMNWKKENSEYVYVSGDFK